MAIIYADLVTLIQQELENDESTFVANIPNFVKMAEADTYLNTQIPDLRKTTTALSTTASNEYLTLPTDFLASYSFAVVSAGEHYWLLNKEPDFMREVYPARLTLGRPRYYSAFDDTRFILAPTPDATYSTELYYFYQPDSIVTTSTSWLGTNAPNTLIYGSFLHAYYYMKGEGDMSQVYKEEYLRALATLQVLTEGRARKDTYRTQNQKLAT